MDQFVCKEETKKVRDATRGESHDQVLYGVWQAMTMKDKFQLRKSVEKLTWLFCWFDFWERGWNNTRDINAVFCKQGKYNLYDDFTLLAWPHINHNCWPLDWVESETNFINRPSIGLSTHHGFGQSCKIGEFQVASLLNKNGCSMLFHSSWTLGTYVH